MVVLWANEGAMLTLEEKHVARGVWSVSSPLHFRNQVQFLASGARPGVLMPGERIRQPIYFAGIRDDDNLEIQIDVDVQTRIIHAHSDELVDWESYFARRDWGHTPQAQKARIQTYLRTELGQTWGEYVGALAALSASLDDFGASTNNVASLLSYLERGVTGFQPTAMLAGAVDVRMRARAFDMSIARTYDYSGACFDSPSMERCPPSNVDDQTVGGFGFGWALNWQVSLWADSRNEVVELLFGGGRVLTHHLDRRDPLALAYVPDELGGRLFREANSRFRYVTASGREMHFEPYDNPGERPWHRLSRVVATSGETVELRYAAGRLSAIEHSDGPCFSFEWNQAAANESSTISAIYAHPEQCIDPGPCNEDAPEPEEDLECGYAVYYSYDDTGNQLIRAGHTARSSFQYAYEAIGPDWPVKNLSRVVYRGREIARYDYDGFGRIASRLRDDGRTSVTVDHGTLGVVQYNLDESRTLTHHYGANLRFAAVTNFDGETWQQRFDNRGNRVKLLWISRFKTCRCSLCEAARCRHELG